MITESTIINLVEEKIKDSDLFIVSVTVKPSNKIIVILDADTSLSIDDCISVSRHIESNLDRDSEDFELEVASAGLGEPLKLPRQYNKNLGKEVSVTTKEGDKIIGKLISSDETSFEVETKRKERLPGKKKKELIIENKKILMEQTKSTKIIVSFK